MANQNNLTKRELQVAGLLLEAKSNAQIALELDITEKTVEYHLTNIYRKLGVSSAREAISTLGKSPELFKPGESPVDSGNRNRNNGGMINTGKRKIINFIIVGILIIIALPILKKICEDIGICSTPTNTPTPSSTLTPTLTHTSTVTPIQTGISTITVYPVQIIVDDFDVHPYPGEAVYPYNRLQGNRGVVNGSVLKGDNGLITTTIATGNTWGGARMSSQSSNRRKYSHQFFADFTRTNSVWVSK